MKGKKKTIYLIDGTAYIYRAYHAIRGLSNSEGMPTNAIFGFTKMLIKLMDDKKPEYSAIFFDMKGQTFRHEIYKEYKANRPPMPEDMIGQIPYIKDVVRGFNLPVIEKEKFEADDLIGTLAILAQEQGFSVVIVSGDKDFIQLVTENTILWDPMKDKTTDLSAVETTYGVEPGRMIDIMGFSGDSADNIPGVPGIGPKTALNLIHEFGTMDGVYEKLDSIKRKKQKENLINFKEQAYLSRRLVTIDTNAPLSFDPEILRTKEPDNLELAKLFRELEFRQLQQAYPIPGDLSKKTYTPILDMEALSGLVKQLEQSDMFAIDTETTSENPMKAELVGFSFCMKPGEAFYIPVAHNYPGVPGQLSLQDVSRVLKPLLENPEKKKVGQNIKYDLIVLLRSGIDLAGVVFDTMLASYLVNPTKRAHSLDQISLDYLDHRMIPYEEVAGKGKKAICFSEVPLDKAVTYSCEDADITLESCNVLLPMLKKNGLSELMEKIEMPLVPVLMKMEMKGICVDKKRLGELSCLYEKQLEDLEKQIFDLAGEEFNIKSSRQLGTILFEKLNLPVKKKTKKKTGYSTDVDVLTELAVSHELPAHVLRHRTLAKLKSTYTDSLLDLVNEETGRVHTSYNQTVTATGRLSSSEPNLQNIPIRTDEGKEIRSAFIPREGWTLVAADYSQIELRILAHYSNDEILIESFNADEDIHTRTATEIFQCFPSFITPDLRRQAKAINFGIIYGMSAFGLAKEIGIGRKMAQTYINNYFARYKKVKQFLDQTIENARETKKTETLSGRVRMLPEINSSNRNVRMFAERTAINTPIQGTAADLIKAAMIEVDAAFGEKGLKSAMLLSVHDELVFEVPPDELDLVKGLVKEIMENVWKLVVPLKVNVDSGTNWMEAH